MRYLIDTNIFVYMASDPEYIAELVYPEEYHWYSGTLTYFIFFYDGTDMQEDNTKIKALPLQNQKYDVFRATQPI